MRTASAQRTGQPWQLTLYNKSLKKRQTVESVLRFLPPLSDEQCLEIGCATGVTSYLMRQRGGTWTSVDFERDHIASAQSLVGERVYLVGDDALPFENDSFDLVVGINFLEHLADDDKFVFEIARVLKSGGTLILTAPTGETGRFGYHLKRAYGFTTDKGGFGHARDGYPPAVLTNKLAKHGLLIEVVDTYSRFFSEAVEDTLNFMYHRQAVKKKGGQAEEHGDFHGTTSPMSEQGFEKVGMSFRIYSLLFPFIRAITLLDLLIPFNHGYMLVCRARKS